MTHLRSIQVTFVRTLERRWTETARCTVATLQRPSPCTFLHHCATASTRHHHASLPNLLSDHSLRFHVLPCTSLVSRRPWLPLFPIDFFSFLFAQEPHRHEQWLRDELRTILIIRTCFCFRSIGRLRLRTFIGGWPLSLLLHVCSPICRTSRARRDLCTIHKCF